MASAECVPLSNIASRQSTGEVLECALRRQQTYELAGSLIERESVPAKRDESMSVESASTGARILVVDDESDICELVKDYLTEYGFRVATVSSGERALASVAREPVELILLDLGLPGITGIEVCQRIRSTGDETPIVVLSAWDEESDKVAALDAGADDYLTKPFGMRELLARIRVALRRTGRDLS